MLLGLLLLGMCALVAWITYARFKINKMAKYSELIPGPKTTPFLGNVLDVGGLKLNARPKDIFDALIKIGETYGSIARFWIGLDLFVIFNDPKYVEAILSSNTELTKSTTYKFVMPWIGYGLLTSEGQKWKKHRRIITPAFHFKILEDFVDVFNFNGKKLVEKLKKKVKGSEFNIYPDISLCTLDIISETAMGVSINALDNEDDAYVKAIRGMANIFMWRSFNPFLQWDPLFNLMPSGKLQRDSLQVLHAMSAKVIKSKKAEYLKKKNSITSSENVKLVDNNDVGSKKRTAFLDLLLEATQETMTMTDDELREEVDTFMFEGHDTTTSGISFTLSSLSHHPDVQEKAYQEQLQIFEDSDREATYQDLQEMKYLEQVIKETQRLFPSVPFYGRILNNNMKIGEYTLPKGTNIMLSPTLLHRNAKYYPNPEKFDPERFSPENSRGRHPYQYIPFSAGPRNCIGQKFAMTEMKATVSKMLRNFKMSAGSRTNKFEELTAELVLKNLHGINIVLTDRK